MAEKIKFHLDENVNNAIVQGLRRRGIDVTTTPEQSLIGASDEEQLNLHISKQSDFYSRYRFPQNESK